MAQDDHTGGTFRPFCARPDMGTLFGQTMRPVASTIGLFTLGCLSRPAAHAGVAVRLRRCRLCDFQRLRVTNEIDSAPLPAASIFLDIFQLFLASVGCAVDGSDPATDAPILITGRNDR